jgi:hypothetical protein
MQATGNNLCTLPLDDECKNLRFYTTETGINQGKSYWGCKMYPMCKHLTPYVFDINELSSSQKKLMTCLHLFIESNNFINATYASLYFNLRNVGILDYILKQDVISIGPEKAEISFSRARIFYSLFYHLYLIPDVQIKLYLRNSFPNCYQRFLLQEKPATIVYADDTTLLPYKDTYLDFTEYEVKSFGI